MRLARKSLTVLALAAVGALALSGCTDSGAAPPEPSVTENVSFDAGTTMAKLNEAGTITVGTKFDQPLFGLAGPDGTPEGFDIEIAKLIAAKLGIVLHVHTVERLAVLALREADCGLSRNAEAQPADVVDRRAICAGRDRKGGWTDDVDLLA